MEAGAIQEDAYRAAIATLATCGLRGREDAVIRAAIALVRVVGQDAAEAQPEFRAVMALAESVTGARLRLEPRPRQREAMASAVPDMDVASANAMDVLPRRVLDVFYSALHRLAERPELSVSGEGRERASGIREMANLAAAVTD